MNFKASFSLLSLILLFASCALLMPEEKRQCYRTLKDFADKHWKYSNHDSVLIENEELFRVARGDDKIDSCLKKMYKKDIQRLFGKPHEINERGVTKYYYFTLKGCKPLSEANFCSYYYFSFNQQDQCISLTAGGVQKSH